jgi:hypothetical protein
MKMRGAVCLGLVWFAIAAPACAQPPAFDPATMQAAKGLMTAIGGDTQITRVLTAMRGVMIGVIVRTGHVTSEKAGTICDEVLMPALKSHVGELTDGMVAVYAQNYTTAELRALTAFYATPLGRKLLEKQPVVATEGMAIGRAWGERVGREAIEKHRQELHDRGVAL